MNVDLPTRRDIDIALAVLPHVDFADRNDFDLTERHDLGVLLRTAYRIGMNAGLNIAAQVVANNQAAAS